MVVSPPAVVRAQIDEGDVLTGLALCPPARMELIFHATTPLSNKILQHMGTGGGGGGGSVSVKKSPPRPYLGTVVGGRRWVENGPAGGGIRIFPPGGGKQFLLQEGGRVP